VKYPVFLAVFVAVGSAWLGCGGDKLVDATAGKASCVDVTCASMHADCGKIQDGCGSVLDCGLCASPEVCGGDGANRCGPAACVPIDCEQAGAECGRIMDGCSDVIDCGACAKGQVCGAEEPNRCGHQACLPSTCESLDAECGVVADGCGGTLSCGTCASGLFCGGNHRCGACEPRSCDGLCGVVDDGCGWTQDCGACGIRHVEIQASGMVSDRSRGRLYLSLPSTFGVDGNSVAILNPATGDIEATLFVGSEPTALALSDDASTLYVALFGAPAVVKVDVDSFSVVDRFDLGTDRWSGPLFAEQIAVLPGMPDSVAVSTWRKGLSPRHGGVGIWDGGVRRANMTRDHTGANRIAFAGSADFLYGYNNESTEYGFRTLAVKPDGLEEVTVVRDLISGFYLDIEASGGLVFSTGGHQVDPAGPSLLGSYASHGPIESDPVTGLTYVVESDFGGRDASLRLFDRDRFVVRGTIALGKLPGDPVDLVRWGDTGLAFRAGTSVLLVDDPAIAGDR